MGSVFRIVHSDRSSTKFPKTYLTRRRLLRPFGRYGEDLTAAAQSNSKHGINLTKRCLSHQRSTTVSLETYFLYSLVVNSYVLFEV